MEYPVFEAEMMNEDWLFSLFSSPFCLMSQNKGWIMVDELMGLPSRNADFTIRLIKKRSFAKDWSVNQRLVDS